ncbi:MAG: CPBP family intramembrane metalloprotease [Candidatus Omnitrophota bacterium]|nr:CPBP family intramembrane metalloprotease [Candidatus Omnitrophota bacterium]
MKLTFKTWIIFIILALVGVAIWYKLSLPEFSVVDLSIDKNLAFKKADGFLKARNVDTSKYSKAIIFNADYNVDRYLQKAVGFKKEESFLRQQGYDLFFWLIRFYQENQKEEYNIWISSKSGEIIHFHHAIEDTALRPTPDKEIAKNKVQEFLTQNFKINFEEFDFHAERAEKFEKRIDYSFSWEKENICIPWSKLKDSGCAKLLTGATISGNEIVEFYRLRLDIPEKFNRLIQNQMSIGQLITSIAMFFYLVWVAWAIIIIVRRRNSFLMHLSKRFFILIGLSILVLNIISAVNDFQDILYSYSTGSSFKAYIGYYIISLIVSFLFASLTIVMSGIAAESLRYDAFQKKKYCSFFHYLISTFYSREVAQSIFLGYLVFLIVMGVQSFLFYLGQRFLGVWVEHSRLTQLSSAYIPFLGALILGYNASLSEEIVFRIFGLSWAKTYLKNSFLAAIVVSLIWGFGHSQYPIFPTWFRGIEVGTIGLLFAFLFLRYGIICLIVAHYLFDVFWGVAGYLIGKSNNYLFYSSLFILVLPLVFAIVAYIINQPDTEKKISFKLSSHQKYNLEILITYIYEKLQQGANINNLKNELILHGWDDILVELAIKELTLRREIN